MPNAKYIKGKKKEYRIVHAFKEEGYDIVVRSAGSHSPVDVWAINKLTRTIKLIQSKSDSMPESQKDKLMREFSWLNGGFRVSFEVV